MRDGRPGRHQARRPATETSDNVEKTMTETRSMTVGETRAANRTYDGTYADLEAILHEWDVVIIDEVDDNPERNPHIGAVDLDKAGLLDALEAWKDAAVRAAVNPADTAFPGSPGSRWHDVDGDMWILGDDWRLHAANCSLDPNEAAQAYGPLTRAGGK